MKKKLCLLLAVVFLMISCSGCQFYSSQNASERLYQEVEEGKHPDLAVFQDDDGFRRIDFNMTLRDLTKNLEEQGLKILESDNVGQQYYLEFDPEKCTLIADYEEGDRNKLQALNINFNKSHSDTYFNEVTTAAVRSIDDTITDEEISKMLDEMEDFRNAIPTTSKDYGLLYYNYKIDQKTTVNKVAIGLNPISSYYKSLHITVNYNGWDLNREYNRTHP